MKLVDFSHQKKKVIVYERIMEKEEVHANASLCFSYCLLLCWKNIELFSNSKLLLGFI